MALKRCQRDDTRGPRDVRGALASRLYREASLDLAVSHLAISPSRPLRLPTPAGATHQAEVWEGRSTKRRISRACTSCRTGPRDVPLICPMVLARFAPAPLHGDGLAHRRVAAVLRERLTGWGSHHTWAGRRGGTRRGSGLGARAGSRALRAPRGQLGARASRAAGRGVAGEWLDDVGWMTLVGRAAASLFCICFIVLERRI